MGDHLLMILEARAARWKAAAKRWRETTQTRNQMILRWQWGGSQMGRCVKELRARIAELEAQIKGRGGSESARTTIAGDHPRHSAPPTDPGCPTCGYSAHWAVGRCRDPFHDEPAEPRATLPSED